MSEDVIEVTLAVKVPAKIRAALRALRVQRELDEGRPYTQAQILAELIEREAERAAERG